MLYLICDTIYADKLLSEQWISQSSLFMVNVMLWMILMVKMFMLLSGFCAQEAFLIVSGCGYRPAKKQEKQGKIVEKSENFNSVRTIDARGCMLGTSFTDFTPNWNMQVHLWLKYYVMVRLMDRKAPKGKMQILPLVLTFVASGVWHGVQSGFLATFIGWAGLDMFAKLAPKTILAQHFFSVLPSWLSSFICWFLYYQFTYYISVGFVLFNYEEYTRVHQKYHYALHYALFVAVLLCFVLPK